MKARKATAQQAIKILDQFCKECAEGEILKAFGWQHPPQQLRRSETPYVFSDQVAPKEGETGDPVLTVIGFGILGLNIRDAADDEAALSAGVFPPYRRRGYWHKIMEWMIERAKKLGADFCSRTVYKENEEHYNRSMREAHEEDANTRWIYAGDIFYPPPGYGYFVHLYDKEAENGKPEESSEKS